MSVKLFLPDCAIMSYNREFFVQLIKMYKEHTCLWKASDPDYRSKNKRNEACERILQLFKTKDPNATSELVSKKINSMRGSFRKELNKVRSSEMSGALGDEVHVPKLWYFDLLYFLKDQDHEIPRVSTSEVSIIDDIPFGYDAGDIYDPVETDSHASSCSTPRTPTPQGSLKRPRSKSDQVLDKIAKRIDRPSKEQFASFGEHVTEKLRYMPPEMVPFCQKLIGDVIFYGETKNLNMTSRIVTEYAMPGSPFPQLHSVAPQNTSVSSELRKKLTQSS